VEVHVVELGMVVVVDVVGVLVVDVVGVLVAELVTAEVVDPLLEFEGCNGFVATISSTMVGAFPNAATKRVGASISPR